MSIVFRVDSTKEIGSGHLYRCLILANSLTESGFNCIFIINKRNDKISELIKFNRHQLKYLSIKDKLPISEKINSHKQWLKHSWKEDAEATINILEKNFVSLVVVDHYSLDYRWERKIKKHTRKIMVIDDLDNRKHECDILLDHNYRSENNAYKKNIINNLCLKLLGLKYLIINKEYVNYKKKVTRENIKKILIFFGGSDSEKLTELIVGKLIKLDKNKYNVSIVIGINNDRKKSIEKLIKNLNNFKCYESQMNLASMLEKNDLVIGALGMNLWERLCIGTPSVVISKGIDQKIFGKKLASKKCIHLIGHYNEVSEKKIELRLKKFLQMKITQSMTSRLQNMVDGCGTERVANELKKIIVNDFKFNLKVRNSNFRDNDLLFNWANHPSVRANSFTSEPIDKKKHKEWFEKRLNNKKQHAIYIGELDSIPVGQVRFDLIEGNWFIDFSVSHKFRRLGVGYELLNQASKKHSKLFSRRYLIGEVKTNNHASRKVFNKLDYKSERKNNIIIFNKKLISNQKLTKKEFLSTKNYLLQNLSVPKPFLDNNKEQHFYFDWIKNYKTEDILRGRNAKHVLREFPGNNKISKSVHNDFIKNYIEANRIDFIFRSKEKNEIVGALYAILHNNELEMGKYIGNTKYLGRGIASKATSRFIEYVQKYFPYQDLVAITKKTNFKNIKLNENKNFFVEKDLHNGFIKMRLILK